MTPLRDLSDGRLVDLFRAGREDAFAALYDRYRLRLVRFARRILSGAADEAEDVVQDAFLRAHAALRASDRAIVLCPWPYTVVRNRALDVRRARGLLRERHHGRPGSLPPLGDPELSLDQRDRLRRVVDQIGLLPARERRALVLRAFEGRTHAELAAELDGSVAATKALVFRARAQLRHEESSAAARVRREAA
jgi:RNA polymerase sigma factor (sigma-70 family)